ncbi:MAG: sodium-translocating pyrophosphatase [Chloroflexi bacterium RIFCSPLOWO2_12_FULL_71_12]|nr:MAG: sodium-translocating pyrophosphatase [Chloroflexi bacterium RIFCSPLOWO2_02_FULL_71_16]OGO73783.1 MAG: sodium-translocating pyrophosphatase [Chloroflexi bacterium RIFCSPLOWO2_12_FULL_71_12]
MELSPLLWIVPISGVVAIAVAAYFAYDVLKSDTGSPEMQRVAGAIYVAAVAFMKRQYRTIAILALVGAALVGFVVYQWERVPGISQEELALKTAFAFLVGASASMLSGIIGMFVAVKSNLRTAAAARTSLGDALRISLRGGAVSGILVVGLSLIGVFAIFIAYNGFARPDEAPFTIVGFGFGASFVALFAQLGGGIYTKAADLGADLVGKIEAGIPEDDPRNAAVVADLVGDNVGDCAGRGADLFESTAAENIGAMILGVAIFAATQNPLWILFPLVVRGFGLVASVIGIFLVRGRETGDPMDSLNLGSYVVTALSIVFMWFTTNQMLNEEGGGHWFFYAGVVGILTSQVFVYITRYYTSGNSRPVQEIAQAAKTGPATTIISGTAVGYETTAPSIIAISVALFGAYWFGLQWEAQTGLTHGGIYGTAVATMGMLMSAAFILAMDTFGPITDNAAGVATMAKAPHDMRDRLDRLDAAGNTTKALTKGYAVASAALAAFLLFSAYLERVAQLTGKPFDTVNLAKVEVFIGGLLGAMLVYIFSSLAIRAVGRAGGAIIEEVRRQFREHPGIMDGSEQPDYARVVDITTASALRNMIAPGLLAVGAPILVGIVLKAEAMAAFLMIGTMSGVILATVLNNGGGAWDNAKKYIELGYLKDAAGNAIGKGTPAHAAAVVGDTVGDPFKDTAGPSLHVLVKLLSTITLVLAPLFI